MRKALAIVLGLAGAFAFAGPAAAGIDEVRVKDLGHFLGWRDSALVGYGLVTGLSGSGDSPNSAVTQQALSNVLSRLGANIPAADLESRNVAAVIVTASLPPTANIGDQINVTVTSIGDARSLVGGTLLMTPLLGADQHAYALAQGSLVVGGYNFRDNGNLRQKNYPTSGVIVGGGTVEASVNVDLLNQAGNLTFVLADPDFTTAERVADGLNAAFGTHMASAQDAETVLINAGTGVDLTRLITEIESVAIRPDQPARVVINERSGTVVAGGAVQISSVVIAQGDVKVSVDAENDPVLAPIAGRGGRHGARSLIVTNSDLDVSEGPRDAVVQLPSTTVADLARALTQAKVDTRTTIEILQAIKAAGALHAEIIVQ